MHILQERVWSGCEIDTDVIPKLEVSSDEQNMLDNKQISLYVS